MTSEQNELKGEYVSVWEGRGEFRCPCTVNIRTREYEIEGGYEETAEYELKEEYLVLDGVKHEASNERHRSLYSPEEQAKMFFWE
jgi:hypothetical protein